MMETIEQRKMYRVPFRTQRCIVPLSGFYEWDRKVDPPIPYYITPKNGQFFLFAGLWEPGGEATGGVPTFTIITSPANKFLGWLHHRIPVSIAPRDREKWLDDDTTLEELREMVQTKE